MQADCVKCCARKGMKDAKSITMKNGRPATQGVCPMWDQDVQNRKELRHIDWESRLLEGLGICKQVSSSFVISHT